MMLEVWEQCHCRSVALWWDGGRREYEQRFCVQQAQQSKVIGEDHWVGTLRPAADVLKAAGLVTTEGVYDGRAL